jgi:hypothetical protein
MQSSLKVSAVLSVLGFVSGALAFFARRRRA